jgi:hypothetical protein
VEPIIEGVGIAVDAGLASPEPHARHPLSFAAHDREIVGIWLPRHPAADVVPRIIAGEARPGSGGVRRRAGSVVSLVRADASMAQAFRRTVDLVLVDATGRDVSTDTWVRLATERAQGTSIVVATRSAKDAYRCDRTVLAIWTLSELLAALDSLAEEQARATRDLLAGASPPRRVAVLAVDLVRGNRALRDLIDLGRRMARSQDDRLRLQELTARAAGVMLDDRILETLIAQAERL